MWEEFQPTNGRQKTCNKKECRDKQERESNKNYQREYRKKENVKLIVKQRKREYYLNNKEEILNKRKIDYNENQEKLLQRRKDYREQKPESVKLSRRMSAKKNQEKNREKNSIRAKTKKNYSHKKIKCERCEETENLEFHHPEPYEVDKFKILCKKHHLEAHNKQKEQIIKESQLNKV